MAGAEVVVAHDERRRLRERKAHGRKWCGHNMAKHIAGEAQAQLPRRVRSPRSSSTLLPPVVPLLRSSSHTRIFDMGVASSCCDSCCGWLFFSNLDSFSHLAPILTTPCSPLAEVIIRAVVVGERAGGCGRSSSVPREYVFHVLDGGAPILCVRFN